MWLEDPYVESTQKKLDEKQKLFEDWKNVKKEARREGQKKV